MEKEYRWYFSSIPSVAARDIKRTRKAHRCVAKSGAMAGILAFDHR